jgi:hypothetical protein
MGTGDLSMICFMPSASPGWIGSSTNNGRLGASAMYCGATLVAQRP